MERAGTPPSCHGKTINWLCGFRGIKKQASSLIGASSISMCLPSPMEPLAKTLTVSQTPQLASIWKQKSRYPQELELGVEKIEKSRTPILEQMEN